MDSFFYFSSSYLFIFALNGSLKNISQNGSKKDLRYSLLFERKFRKR
jgi:hypothetical protein